MNSNLYKNKIRRTLIVFAIVPLFLVILIGLIGFYALYFMKTSQDVSQSTTQMTKRIHSSEKQVKQEFKQFIEHIPKDETDKYRALYRLANQEDTLIFYFKYDKVYTNKVHQQLVPLYETSGEVNHQPYTFKVYIDTANLHKTAESDIVITDLYDNIYFATNPMDALDKKFETNTQAIQAEKQVANLKLTTYKDVSDIMSKGVVMLIILGITFVSLIIIALITSQMLSKRQTKDIDEIIAAIRQAQVRALKVYQPLTQQSELEIINRYVYELSYLNEKLLASTKASDKALRDAQLKSLEHQFQPHFIFNTMQIINYMIDSDPKAAKKMMIKLSSILRYALRVHEAEVTFEKEINYLKDYLYIQNIRFEGQIQYQFEVNPTLQNITTDKLLIQPLIENAIKYREETALLNIKIRIESLSNGDLFIGVLDNGQGMTEERKYEVRQLIEHYHIKHNHIGMQTIHQTLRIKYGKQYGMKVYSKDQHGTMIVLRVKKGVLYE